MKKIKLSPEFKKSYRSLLKWYRPDIVGEVTATLKLLINDPNNPILRNHLLKGTRRRKKSISVNMNIRIIFLEKEDHYLLLDIGTHNKVYN